MSETISTTTNESITNQSTKLEESMDFTLDEHYKERIAYHMKMLNHYLIEELNEKLVT